MLPEELSTQEHDGKNCFKFGSLKKKSKTEDFSSTGVLVWTLNDDESDLKGVVMQRFLGLRLFYGV